ncbi:MAG: phosphatase PAP2 family protein [Pseudomonadales bacterium]
MGLANTTLFKTIHDWDVDVFQRWQRRAHRAQIMRVARKVSLTADGWPYVLFAFVYYLVEPVQGAVFATALAWALLLERSCYFVMKNSFRRKRPPAALPNFTSFIVASDEFSFPSGHTSGAFLFASCLVLVFGPMFMITYVWAGLVALSRISLGVHFPTDTAMGALMGSSIALLSYYYLVI